MKGLHFQFQNRKLKKFLFRNIWYLINSSIEQVESTKITNNGEMIVLKKDGEFDEEGDDLLSKLALSNGLADSVKVASLENFIDDHIERVREIPPILESGKHLPIR